MQIPGDYALAVREIRRLLDTGKSPVLVAVDGRCGSGKTTLAGYLAGQFDLNLFHMDDFYLRKEQRTEERLKEPGGNVDYERFKEQVIGPILRGENVNYRGIIHGEFTVSPEGTIMPPKRLNLIEGSYSHHPYFGDVYDLRLFVTAPVEERLSRILARNGPEKLVRFQNEWIPKEEKYFQAFAIEEKALVIRGMV